MKTKITVREFPFYPFSNCVGKKTPIKIADVEGFGSLKFVNVPQTEAYMILDDDRVAVCVGEFAGNMFELGSFGFGRLIHEGKSFPEFVKEFLVEIANCHGFEVKEPVAWFKVGE